MGEEEAAAAAGGGGRCCWGEDASSLSASRGWAVSVPITERVSPCSYIYPSALFAEPTGGTRLGSMCQFLFVPLPELGYAHCAEPTGGTRPGGT